MTDSEILEIRADLKAISAKLDAYHESVTVLNTVVLGRNGDAGLVGAFEKSRDELNKRMDEACEEQSKFRSKCILVFGILVGSGVLGGSIFGVIKLIS
jgi:hypothetical protein